MIISTNTDQQRQQSVQAVQHIMQRGGEMKQLSFVNVVPTEDGTEVELSCLSQEERRRLSELWTERFMLAIGYVKKKETG